MRRELLLHAIEIRNVGSWNGVARASDGIAAVGLDFVQVPRVAPGIADASHGPHVLLLRGVFRGRASDEDGQHEEGEDPPRSCRSVRSTHRHLIHEGWNDSEPSRITCGMAVAVLPP